MIETMKFKILIAKQKRPELENFEVFIIWEVLKYLHFTSS